MKINYIVKYAWWDIWHAGNRPFTLLNILAISISVTTLVILAGGGLAFRENSEQVMNSLGLRIEVSNRDEGEISADHKKKLQSLPGIASIHWWTPTVFLFYNKKGRLHDGIGGQTVDLDDPLIKTLKDIRDQSPLRFYRKSELPNSYMDEIGLIIPFTMLKQLGYLPASASADKRSSWQSKDFPTTLKIRVKENHPRAVPVDIPLPVIGVVANLEEGRYLMTKDAYQVLGTDWRNSFRPFLFNRNGNRILPDASSPQLGDNPLANHRFYYSETHASIYVQNRDALPATLTYIRNLGLRADCALEYYLEDYQQQENFFLLAAGGICLTLFIFSGIILFATFYALVLRKMREIGILKAYGVSSHLVNKIFNMQAVLISGMAIAIGIAIGMLCGWKMSSTLQKALDLPDVNWFLLPPAYLGIIVVLGIGFCLLAIFFPVRMATKMDPDQVIRT